VPHHPAAAAAVASWVSPPDVLEPVRRQRRVDGGAVDRPMAEPALDRPGVVSLVGEGVTAGVAKHVRVALSSRPAQAAALDHPGEAGRDERRAALADEDEGRGRIVRLGLAQIGQSKTTGGTTIFRFPAHAEQMIVFGLPSHTAAAVGQGILAGS
jgi:hypothetical protein